MSYLAVYAIYCNCSIIGEEEREIEAKSLEEAKELAKGVGEAIEAERLAVEPKADWWACLEEILEEHE